MDSQLLRLQTQWRSDPDAADQLFALTLRRNDTDLVFEVGASVVRRRKDAALLHRLWTWAWRCDHLPGQVALASTAAHWLHEPESDHCRNMLGTDRPCTCEAAYFEEKIRRGLGVPEDLISTTEPRHVGECPQGPAEASESRDRAINWIWETTRRGGSGNFPIALRALLASSPAWRRTQPFHDHLQAQPPTRRRVYGEGAQVDERDLCALVEAYSLLGDDLVWEDDVIAKACERTSPDNEDRYRTVLRYHSDIFTWPGTPGFIRLRFPSDPYFGLPRYLWDLAGFSRFAFPLVRRVYAGNIANQIVSVQPMIAPTGLNFYTNYAREDARFTAALAERWDPLLEGIPEEQRGPLATLLQNQAYQLQREEE